MFVSIDGEFPGLRKSAVVCANQSGESVSALHIASKLNIVPAFAVAHRRVGYSLKKVYAIKRSAEKQLRMQDPALARGSAYDLQVEPVELLPHFRAALFADLPQIFARCRNAGDDRRRIGTIESQRVGERCGVYFPARRDRNLQRVEQAQPASRACFGGLIEAQLEINVDEARGVLGPLQIAAHPVQAVGDSGKHGLARLTGALSSAGAKARSIFKQLTRRQSAALPLLAGLVRHQELSSTTTLSLSGAQDPRVL